MRFTDILTSSAHAFIVEGRNGETRDRFVRDFVAGLNCECEDVNRRPCNSCAACRQLDAGTSMDVFHMEKSGKTAYKVEDAAAMVERLGMGSYGRHIIGIVDEADLLSESIQNKLLKTLEEPEEGAVIILATTNRDNLLRTVRSRCNIIRISDYDGYEGDVEEDATANEEIQELAKLVLGKTRFFEARAAIDKKIKSQEDAMMLLGVMEDVARDVMINKQPAWATKVELIETARMDIYRGMQYGKALKRLFLELA